MRRWTVLASAAAALMAGAAMAGQALQAPPAAVQRHGPPLGCTSFHPSECARVAEQDRAAVHLPAVTALFRSYVRTDKMPGIVGAFGHGDATPTLFVSSGWIADDRTAPLAGPDTLWRVYSMTKPVTALAAMILIDDGKIGLDDPLSKYFPAFAHMRVLTDPDHSLAARPAARPITIRNLLTHTAGLGYSIVTKGPLLHEYERLGLVPFAINAPTEAQVRPTRPATLAEFANRVATAPLIADPGTIWSYSIGLDVMGAVIEKASGMPFDAFVNARIFTPLGMTSSYWQAPAGTGRLATDYAFALGQRAPLDPAATSVFLQRPSFPYGGAGLVMSARDHDTFLHLLQDDGTLNGVTILSARTANLMMSNLLPSGVSFGGVGDPGARIPSGFGAGGAVTLSDGPGGFPGKGTYGWSGAAGTIGWVDRAHRFRATVMVNYLPGEQYPLRADTIRALMADGRSLGL